jgi:hypothetical protein
MPTDVKNILRGTGIALEQQAFSQFGAAVEGQVRSLGLIGGNQVPGVNDVNGPLPLKSGEAPIRAAESAAYAKSGVWEPTRYASALTQADQGNLDPKQKFLFKVAFYFDHNEGLQTAFSTLGGSVSNNDLNRALTFMVKQIDLPKVTFEYEEVNMYNYRTKVLKSISHRELNFSFMDDVGNNVIDFVNIYRMLLQPMARQNASSWETAAYEDYGFRFDQDNLLGSPSSSLRGIIPGNSKRILRKIVIHQFYLNKSSSGDGTVENMVRTNDFVFLNPQLTEMDMGEMDHENSQLNLVTCNFAFDGLVVIPNQSVFNNGQYKHKDISLDVRDMLTGPAPSLNVNRGSAGITAGGKSNPFTNIITNQAGRLVQTAVGNALSKTGLGTVAGGALSGVLYQVTSSLGDRTKQAIGGWTQGTAAPNVSYVRDQSVSRQEAQNLSGREVSSPGDGS